MGKTELVALLNLSTCCLVIVERLFLVVPWGCVRLVIVVFPDHTHCYFPSEPGIHKGTNHEKKSNTTSMYGKSSPNGTAAATSKYSENI